MFNNKNNIINVIALIMLVIAVIVVCIAIRTSSKFIKVDDINNSIDIEYSAEVVEVNDDILAESVGTEAPVDTEESLIDLYNKFYSINNDVVAYMRIRESNINLPVAQQHTVCSKHNTIDNCYYLYRDIYKRSAINNTAIQFMEANNKVGKTISEFDQTTIVYGHTWSNNERRGKEVRIGDPNDTQFDQLVSYTDMDWLDKHRVLEFTTGDEITYWVPQYVMYTDAVKRTNPNGFNYSKRTLSPDDIQIMIDRSVIVNQTEVNLDTDKLLILSTCNSKYENDGTNRLVVVFKYIEADNYADAVEAASHIKYQPHDIVVDWVK